MPSNKELENFRKYCADNISLVKKILEDIFSESSYNDWLNNPVEFACTKFIIPKTHSNNYLILENMGIIRNELLNVVINKSNNRLYLTDGNWENNTSRVHPYQDESEDIYNYAINNHLYEWADLLIDPACGSGHHCLNTSNVAKKYGFDINERAILYSKINSLLCNDHTTLFTKMDIKKFDMKEVSQKKKNILICANMPFGIFSHNKQDKPLSQYGGKDGDELNKYLFHAIINLKIKNPASYVKSIILFTTLGDNETNKWNIIEYAKSFFGKESVKYMLIHGKNLLRINGIKRELNIMPIESLHLKSKCRITFNDEERKKTEENYLRKSKEFKSQSLNHLAYGLMEINL